MENLLSRRKRFHGFESMLFGKVKTALKLTVVHAEGTIDCNNQFSGAPEKNVPSFVKTTRIIAKAARSNATQRRSIMNKSSSLIFRGSLWEVRWSSSIAAQGIFLGRDLLRRCTRTGIETPRATSPPHRGIEFSTFTEHPFQKLQDH